MSTVIGRHIDVFFNRYYWQTAVLIAKNSLARLYRNSFLGILWTLLQPITMVVVYATIMPLIMRSTTANYRLYIMVSLPIWGFFSACLVGASNSLLSNGETLKRCMVSSTVFPIADVLRNTYTFFVSFVTIYGMAVIVGIASPDPIVLAMLLYFIPILMIIGALSIAIAFIAPYIRDIGELTTVAMTMLFWFTPIIYQPDILPPKLQQWMQWNPFYIMIHPLQMLAYYHAFPDGQDVAKLCGLTIIAIGMGFGFFKLCRRNYVYYL